MLENLAEHPPIPGGQYLNPRRRRPPSWLWRKVRSGDGSKVAAGPSTCGDWIAPAHLRTTGVPGQGV